MIRAFQIAFVLAAAALLAACSHLRAAKQRLEYRGFLEDWGVNKPKRPWIYVPVVVAAMLLSSCQTAPRAPDPFDTMLGEAAASMFRDVPMMPNSLK